MNTTFINNMLDFISWEKSKTTSDKNKQNLDNRLMETFQMLYYNHRIWRLDRRLELVKKFINRKAIKNNELMSLLDFNYNKTVLYLNKICDFDKNDFENLKNDPKELFKVIQIDLTERRIRILENFLYIHFSLINIINQPKTVVTDEVPTEIIEKPQQSATQIPTLLDEKQPAEKMLKTETEESKQVVSSKKSSFFIKNNFVWKISFICILLIIVFSTFLIQREISGNVTSHSLTTSSKPINFKSNSQKTKLFFKKRASNIYHDKKKTKPSQTITKNNLKPEIQIKEAKLTNSKFVDNSIFTKPLEETKKPLHKVDLSSYIKPPPLAQRFPLFEHVPLNFIRGNSHKKIISITFDGGSEGDDVDTYLNILKRYHLHCTFFLTGHFIQQNPDKVKEILAAGNEIGNHTFSHPHISNLTDDEFKEELLKANQVYYSLTRQQMSPFWRAPFGEYSTRLARAARKIGFMHIHWTHWKRRKHSLDTIDWVEDPTSKLFHSALEITHHILNSDYKSGGIVLMHVGARKIDPLYDKFPLMIEGLKKQGYSIITISKMLEYTYGNTPHIARKK